MPSSVRTHPQRTLEAVAILAGALTPQTPDGLHDAVDRFAADHEHVRILPNIAAVNDAIATLVSRARHEVFVIRDPSPRTAHFFARDLDRHRDATRALTGRGVRLRSAYDVRVLDFPHVMAVIAARRAAGEESRFISTAAATLVVAHDLGAVVDFSSIDSSGAGSLAIAEPRSVAALIQLARSEWDDGTQAAHDCPLDAESQDILTLLAAGATDATIAVQTGLSRRTIERRVQSLLRHCGATTRFQAAVVATRRGWI